MMEGPPPTPERKIDRQEVIEKIRANGLEDPETKEMVMKWTVQREQEVQTSRDAIVFNIERTDLYLAAGDKEGAIENLEDALMQAQQENEKELYDEILKKIEEIEKT